ncbi:hypothetical protein UFOVP837_34 [uncultured Caudovirales phage]|uniref:Uncharacterized protein n=1 Tax=uncultured Caudovirales phage TaxID=2100421 RepID=A0A6J5PBH3_9CAUD|nr:hypothetical protein UFOVP837_34 [uncultured Caudovirales phage]
MAHYVKVVDGLVVNGIVAEREFFDTFVDSSPGTWVKTSYNIRGGVYYDPTTGEPHVDQAGMISADEGRQRKNYAGINYTYDSVRDAFIPPKPYASWLLNEDTCLWDAPVAYPTDGKRYTWDEATTNWVEAN